MTMITAPNQLPADLACIGALAVQLAGIAGTPSLQAEHR
jgi:hypothetical protein